MEVNLWKLMVLGAYPIGCYLEQMPSKISCLVGVMDWVSALSHLNNMYDIPLKVTLVGYLISKVFVSGLTHISLKNGKEIKCK